MTVQVLTADWPIPAGLHPRVDTSTGGYKADGCGLGTGAEGCGYGCVLIARDGGCGGGVEGGGGGSGCDGYRSGYGQRALLLPRVTVEPPAGAVWVRVTVQVLTADWPRLVGLHVRVDTRRARQD